MRWPFVGFLLAAVCAMSVPLPVSAQHPGKTDVFSDPVSLSHVTGEGARYDERAGGFRLQDDANGGYRLSGSVTADALRYNFGFNRAVVSWNADCPEGTWITVELQVRPQGSEEWTSWYEMASWGDRVIVEKQPEDGRVKADDLGKVNEDTLELKDIATRLRYRITLHTRRPEVTPVVTLVAVAVADSTRQVELDNTPGPAWGKEVPADFRSQLVENGDLSWRVCGPTSAAMGLTAYGVQIPTANVARACWDELNSIYGNWPFIAAGVSELLRKNAGALPERNGQARRFQSFVYWPPDWKGVEQEILNGNPVILSIRTGRDELSGAPYRQTDGHLILVRGFTKDGNVICNDPAAWTAEKGQVVYDRQELHRARQGNPVIVFRPYG